MNEDIFNQAVDFLIHGKHSGLKDIIREYPDIVHQRSSSDHGAQLIHYLGANGVEDHLQKSPANAVKMAELLLSNGADPNSPAKLYGNDSYVLDLLASSVHPYLAGVQPSLIKVLIDGGAKINGNENDDSPLGLALGFGYTGAAEMLYQLGDRVDNILFAAGLGLLDSIKEEKDNPDFLNYKCNTADRVGAFTWPPPELYDPRINAMIYAAFRNRIDVVQYFIDQGLNPNCHTKMNQTPLHFAAYMGHIEMVKLLIDSGAKPDNQEDQWNSVPAGWAKQNNHDLVFQYLINRNAS